MSRSSPQYLPVKNISIPMVGVGAQPGGFVVMLGVVIAENDHVVYALTKEGAQQLCQRVAEAVTELEDYENNPPQNCN